MRIRGQWMGPVEPPGRVEGVGREGQCVLLFTYYIIPIYQPT